MILHGLALLIVVLVMLVKKEEGKGSPSCGKQQYKQLFSGWDLNCRGTSKFSEKLYIIAAVIMIGMALKDYLHMYSGLD